MIQLSKRLQAVAELAAGSGADAQGDVGRIGADAQGDAGRIRCVADVGTDHGYIPIRLVEQGIADRAIAMDIRTGPLQRAQEHIREHKLEEYIETRLSDGLSALRSEEAQVIVIAGMGGATMSRILEAGQSVISKDTILVLQPQSELYEFRRYLAEHDFILQAENMVVEDGKYYPMMKVQRRSAAWKDAHPENAVSRGDNVVQQDGSVCEKTFPYTELELQYGPLLLAQRHPVLNEFLLWQLAQKERILEQIQSSGKGSVSSERREHKLQEEIEGIRQTLKRYGF